MLEHCGFSAATAGELGIFTPAWVTIARVPTNKNDKEHQKRIGGLPGDDRPRAQGEEVAAFSRPFPSAPRRRAGTN